ncbi:MAG TPA: ABC transporter substrate-binding protein [Casimicrobiaceae bacterium]|nr:ABC transporter substrate-binding protein [Casimicrobiaceae bacterium]
MHPSDLAPPVALRQALRDFGYVEGRNVTYAARWAEARSERLAGLAGELVALKPDLLLTTGWKGAHALKEVTSTIPIVFVGAGDPVRGGLSNSLSRPGGNATGISDQSVELSAKRLEFLKEADPMAARIAVLWNADDMAMTLRYHEIEKAAQVLGVRVLPLGVREPEDFEQAFSAMTRERPDAFLLVTDALTNLNRRRVLEFAAAHRIPAMYEYAYLVRDGGLISYGPDFDDMYRRAAVYVDRILKGAAPGELAIEQPTRYYLVVNLTTAQSLGLTVPSALLLRADEVIQ